MNNRTIVVVLIIFFLTALAAMLYVNQREEQDATPGVTPTPTQVSEASPSPAENDDSDWEEFESEDLGIRIEHPEDVNRELREDRVVFIKVGPSQEMNTEFYDGISLSLRRDQLAAQEDVEDVANNVLNDLRDMQLLEKASDVESFRLAGRNGYRFTVTTLGRHTYMYLPAENNEYLEIVNSTVDPGDLGFEETVERMLSTLEFI